MGRLSRPTLGNPIAPLAQGLPRSFTKASSHSLDLLFQLDRPCAVVSSPGSEASKENRSVIVVQINIQTRMTQALKIRDFNSRCIQWFWSVFWATSCFGAHRVLQDRWAFKIKHKRLNDHENRLSLDATTIFSSRIGWEKMDKMMAVWKLAWICHVLILP